jgi:hypothetical protein
MQDPSKITSRAEIKNQKELCLCLESVIQTNNKWMLCIAKNISLSLSVSNQILTQNALL